MQPISGSCPYSGSGPRTFEIASTTYDYYFAKYGKKSLHGVFLVPKDLPSTIAVSMPSFRATQQFGIGEDDEIGISALATQSDYTQAVVALRSHHSTYARNNLDYIGTVLLRKEAVAQGVKTVKVWDCNFQCYDKRFIAAGGSAVEGQYAWLNTLPLEDAGHNATLDAFLKYDTKPDAFGMQAFIAGTLFTHAVNDVVAKSGPNGLTRVALLDALRNTHDFDAGGFLPTTDIGNKTHYDLCRRDAGPEREIRAR